MAHPLTTSSLAAAIGATDTTDPTARISRADLYERYGVVHVADQVLMLTSP